MKKVKLGELFKIKQGFAFKSEKYLQSGKYVLCTLGNFSADNNFKLNQSKWNYYPDEFSHEFILFEGDLVIPLTEQAYGLFGNTAFIPKTEGFQFVLNQRVGRIIINENAVDKYYLHYLLSTETVKAQIEASARGTSQRNTSPDKIYDVIVWIPDLYKQKAIGKLLYDIEQKINLNNAINDNLQQVAKTLYDYWFTQFDFPDENGRPYKTSGGKMVWNEQLKREIPAGWEVKALGELLNVATGKEDANFSTPNGKYKFFTCSNSTLNCEQYAFDGEAVLIAGNGDFNVKHYSGKFNAYQRTYVLIPTDKRLRAPIYLVALRMINQFKSGSNGSIVKFITKGDIENIRIFIPDNISLYTDLNSILYEIEANMNEIEYLISLRNFLLPLLMNGQAVISD